MLMILDGVGLSDRREGNAFLQAKTPNIDTLMNKYPTSRLAASGMAVGLPDGQMGNSEVGHMNIGAGRTIYQDFTRIAKSISDGTFFDNEALTGAIKNAKDNNTSLHVMGLVSDGGVHSHQDHLFAVLELAKRSDLHDVYVHVFTDGRDTAPSSAISYVDTLERKIQEIGVGKIATVCGRYYSMDRDNRWDRTKLAYDAIVCAEGAKGVDVRSVILESYNNQVTDEFILPTVIGDYKGVVDGDSLIFFNFRLDRARQLTRAFADEDFNGFERSSWPSSLVFVNMTECDATISNVEVAFRPQDVSRTFGEHIAGLGYSQLRIAETEKYAHVTFYFSGGQEIPFSYEDRILVPSPKVATYDLQPEMSAVELTEKTIESIRAEKYDIIIINFANGDIVGHTGMMDKAIEAVEVLDDCVGKIVDEMLLRNGESIIIADHGNCEYMLDEQGNVATSHSVFDVPCIVVSDRVSGVENGKLCDVAPTMLTLMGELIPDEMTGRNLIEYK
jgi:2,3-bisphosphoglycerate-independent phosphoglycerate mutase